MGKKLSDYKWSHLQRLEKVLSDDDIIIFPINTIRTVKIMELSHICKIVNYLKKDNDYNSLAKELKKFYLIIKN